MTEAKHFNSNNMGAISQRQFDAHYALYSGYINKINEIDKGLKDSTAKTTSNAVYSPYRALKEGETFCLDSIILHELYFQNLGIENESVPNAAFNQIATKHFGGFNKWLEDFTSCAQSARGWVIFGYEQRTNTFRNILLDAHNVGTVVMHYPILVLDMYEHAYYVDYINDKNSYIKNFVKNTNWTAVNNRLDKLNIN